MAEATARRLRVSVSEVELATSRQRVGMMATLLIFLGGFALAALFELPQAAVVGKDWGVVFSVRTAHVLEWVLVVIAGTAIIGALAGIAAYNTSSVLSEVLDGLKSGRLARLRLARFCRDWALFRTARALCLWLTYLAVLLCLTFLCAFGLLLSQSLAVAGAMAAIVLGVLFGVIRGARQRAARFGADGDFRLNGERYMQSADGQHLVPTAAPATADSEGTPASQPADPAPSAPEPANAG